MSRLVLPIILLASVLLASSCGFAEHQADYVSDAPGLLHGIWHGLIAPWTLWLRGFLDVQMYALPSPGWFYDAGFLPGIVGSLPIGWLAAVVQVVRVLL